MITINGDKISKGSEVKAMGQVIPVDKNGKFVMRQIVPSGHHVVNITLTESNGTKSEFTRPLYIPDEDWFYIALADLTIGRNNVKGPASLVTGDTSKRYKEKTFTDGRLAFYSKGKVKGDWLLTASADTREQPLEDLFSNFSAKDPRHLLKRIDPNAYYPVYGDDSTSIEDAPTQGKFYMKLQKGDSHVMWGNFQTKITGTDLLNYGRTLYGVNAEYSGEQVTSFGEKRTEANIFAADPGSLPSLEEFRGTGGSLYYLRAQDLVVGSERLRIETRDKDSGIVLKTENLVAGQDYEVNYIQGRLTLREALSSTSSDGQLIRTGSLSGNPVFLVAEYEYTPGVTSIDNLTKGGRVSHWVNDYLKIGVTGYKQDGTGIDQKLLGADATLRYSAGTYLKLEKAKSDGAGTGSLSSPNGGFNFNSISQTRTANIKADAHRAEIGLDLADITKGKADGKIGAYTLRRDDGFSSPGQLTSEGITQHGLTTNIPVNDKLDLNGKLDYKSGSTTGKVQVGRNFWRL